MGSSSLPQDILLLLCQELAARRDFATLFRCSIVSRRLASIALEQLYGMREVQDPFPEDRLNVARLWRSIILSSTGSTAYPYCAYVRALSLGSLEECLEDVRVHVDVRALFFESAMQEFIVAPEGSEVAKTTRQNSGRVNIHIRNTMRKCADSVTRYIKELAENTGTTVALAHLEGYHIPFDLLPTWITRLSTLTSLRLRDGSVLGTEAAKAIAETCPRFADLTCYYYQNGDTGDEDMAAFFRTLPPNTLQSFEVISRNQIGQHSFTALNTHADSLKTLKLRSLSPASMKSLNMLPDCTSLEALSIENDVHDRISLAAFSEGLLGEIASWIRNCKSLQDLELNHVQDALVIIKEVLSAPHIHLISLDVQDFSSVSEQETAAAWSALGLQDSLEFLTLGLQDRVVDGLILANSPLPDSICKLKNLTSLNLMQAYVTPNEIQRFAKTLPKLSEFSFSGEYVDDSILEPLSTIPELKILTINATSVFKFNGLQDFANKLDSPGHRGVRVEILNQWGECKFTGDEEKWLDNYFAFTLGGRIAITYPIDPDELHEADFSESD